ncbi:MAG: F0F1 ATP synthase subunit epsilon [Proteobacteria bacterium]|nr:F0F1 ATP synthase subunit epsilon [Pseudomonadota bacterium]
MRLLITTPTQVVVDESGVQAVRAEDESGSFGILEGHDDLLTALAVSIVSWRGGGDKRRYCAVRRGVLSVMGGHEVAIATREAIACDDLDRLEQDVLTEFRKRAEVEQTERVRGLELQMKAIRQIVRFLRPEKAGAGTGAS